jgi:hypothetical protein
MSRDTRSADVRYLIVVDAADVSLYRHLQTRFDGDARTRVILDRRHRAGAPGRCSAPDGVERRVRAPRPLFSLGATVIRLTAGSPTQRTLPHEPAGRRPPLAMEGIEDRQRVDRWLEESQYLIGRMIPAYLDDRDRVRARLETVEEDNARLRAELADARREIAQLCGEVDFHRGERARVADNFRSIIEHLTAMQGPVNDIASRLDAQPATAELRV